MFFFGCFVCDFPKHFFKDDLFLFLQIWKKSNNQVFAEEKGDLFLKWLRRLSRKTDYLDSAGPISSPNPARF